MEELELIGGTGWISALNGDAVEVRFWQLVYTILVYKERFSDSQLKQIKAAIDRETLHRSKLINSQTKV